MSYRFLEDFAISDVAFEATGKTLPELFAAACEATLQTMISNTEAIDRVVSRSVELEHSELDLLLFNLLQEIIFYKDAEQLILRPDTVEIASEKDRFRLKTALRGEKLDPSRHEQRTDVKAVTLYRFTVEETAGGWRALVILDV